MNYFRRLLEIEMPDNTKRFVIFRCPEEGGVILYDVFSIEKGVECIYAETKDVIDLDGRPIGCFSREEFHALDFDVLSQYIEELDMDAKPVKFHHLQADEEEEA